MINIQEVRGELFLLNLNLCNFLDNEANSINVTSDLLISISTLLQEKDINFIECMKYTIIHDANSDFKSFQIETCP